MVLSTVEDKIAFIKYEPEKETVKVRKVRFFQHLVSTLSAKAKLEKYNWTIKALLKTIREKRSVVEVATATFL